MTHPPLYSSPLAEAIHDQNTALLAGQRETIGLLTLMGEKIMASAEDTKAGLEAIRAEGKAAEERAQTEIAKLLDAATAANAALQALVDQLKARPDVPDDVAALVENVRADFADDFAPEAPAPDAPPAA